MTIHGSVEMCSTVSRSNRLATQPLDDEMVMANLETGEYYGLESCGMRIWELLAKPTSVASLCEQLTKEYSVGRAQCEHDVTAFVRELHREGLIRLHADPAQAPLQA